MKLHDELYFEIDLTGAKEELIKFVRFLKSGVLEDFFEVSSSYIIYPDNFARVHDDAETQITFTNDDIAIEITSFCPEEFLEVLCKGGRTLDIRGHLYDIEDEVFTFFSPVGDIDFYDAMQGDDFDYEPDDYAYDEDE